MRRALILLVLPSFACWPEFMHVGATGNRQDHPTPPPGDSWRWDDEPYDTQQEEDPYFSPSLFEPGADFAVHNRNLGDAMAMGAAYPATFTVALVDNEFLSSQDEQHRCTLSWTLAGTPGPVSGDDSLIFILDLTPATSTCDNLDPNLWGLDPFTAFERNWGLALSSPSAEIEALFGDTWAVYGPSVLGGTLLLDSTPLASTQDLYFILYALDETLSLTGEKALAADVLAGVDAWFAGGTLYYADINLVRPVNPPTGG